MYCYHVIIEIRGKRSKWQQTLFLKPYHQDINLLIVDDHTWYTSFLSWTCCRRKNPIFYAPLQRRNWVYCFAAVCMQVSQSTKSFHSFYSQRLHVLKWNLLYRFIVIISGQVWFWMRSSIFGQSYAPLSYKNSIYLQFPFISCAGVAPNQMKFGLQIYHNNI